MIWFGLKFWIGHRENNELQGTTKWFYWWLIQQVHDLKSPRIPLEIVNGLDDLIQTPLIFFLISSVWKAFWNEIVQKSFVPALCIVFSCEFYSIEIKIDQYFHCILNYVMLSDFINILWCIFKFDQLDLACLFWSSETLWVFDWYISHQYFKNQEVVFKIQYHKILSPDFKIGQLYLINTTRNLAKNIYQMIEHKVCDSSTETRLGKIPQHRKANRQVFRLEEAGFLKTSNSLYQPRTHDCRIITIPNSQMISINHQG